MESPDLHRSSGGGCKYDDRRLGRRACPRARLHREARPADRFTTMAQQHEENCKFRLREGSDVIADVHGELRRIERDLFGAGALTDFGPDGSVGMIVVNEGAQVLTA